MDDPKPKGLAVLIGSAKDKMAGEGEGPEEGDTSEMGASVARDVLGAIKGDDEQSLSRAITNLIRMCQE